MKIVSLWPSLSLSPALPMAIYRVKKQKKKLCRNSFRQFSYLFKMDVVQNVYTLTWNVCMKCMYVVTAGSRCWLGYYTTPHHGTHLLFYYGRRIAYRIACILNFPHPSQFLILSSFSVRENYLELSFYLVCAYIRDRSTCRVRSTTVHVHGPTRTEKSKQKKRSRRLDVSGI